MAAALNALICTSSGYCLAVGDYLNKFGMFRPMAVQVPAP